MKLKIITIMLIAGLQYLYAAAQNFRAPAYPLITHDSYFSIWSTSDKLTDSPTKHWTGANQSLTGLIKVDGTTYRFMGSEDKNYIDIVPTANLANYNFQYVETKPAYGWEGTNFNDNSWKTGAAPFGDNKGQDKTYWKSDNIWARRTFYLKNLNFKKLYLKINHDDNIQVYLNGEKIYNKTGWLSKFAWFEISGDIIKKLKIGKNVLAMHCANTAGGTHLDAGLSTDPPEPKRKTPIYVADQKSVDMNAIQTIYNFTAGKIDLTLTFTSPLLLKDLNLLSRPVSYIAYKVKANDGKAHNVQVYFGASTDIAVNEPAQPVTTKKYVTSSLSILKAGTVEQPILQKRGDDLRIDWGYMYVAVPKSYGSSQYITSAIDAMNSFSAMLPIENTKDGTHLVLNTIIPLGNVSSVPKEQFIMLGYDDIYAIQYFNKNLKAWWKLGQSKTMETEMAAAARDYKAIIQKCKLLNTGMERAAVKAGGVNYAKLCVLGYRQSIAAHKLVKSPQGDVLFLSKENFSNGCINTVDVTYPSAPLYLTYNPKLMEGMLNGIFYFSESGKYNKPFAAHDLGTYPQANGEVYGEGMPVEESGNMLILTAAICKAERSAAYAKKHWKTLTTWAEYLNKSGFDPENQLCTDDFAGHLARNTNLSVKAIVALGSYALLAEQLGDKETAARYRESVKAMVPKWMKLADAGDHYALTFDNKNSWSQKYNMVWDKVLGLNLFPKSVYQKEVKYYLSKQNNYGLPLDSRKTYTKADWVLWTAGLADNQADFKALTDPVLKYSQETSSRVPMSDWYETTTGKQVSGMQARSVVGGYFMKMLEDKLTN
ncbi:glutaminase family protein [Mucilaginibacter sp.]|uniref:glutaminase family protein n=1 Tax=Mucilaginibacter sp. TaxID=1882438 RepID=UPI0025D4F3FF|nr:glutaminase family protein [Mucilaginibacter sp.]